MTFQDGDRLSGKILSMGSGKLEIDTTLAGEVKVDWKEVATFSSDGSVELRLVDGHTVVGQTQARRPAACGGSRSERPSRRPSRWMARSS